MSEQLKIMRSEPLRPRIVCIAGQEWLTWFSGWRTNGGVIINEMTDSIVDLRPHIPLTRSQFISAGCSCFIWPTGRSNRRIALDDARKKMMEITRQIGL
jgi:hypothetical protein